jgi:hypothetical protein
MKGEGLGYTSNEPSAKSLWSLGCHFTSASSGCDVNKFKLVLHGHRERTGLKREHERGRNISVIILLADAFLERPGPFMLARRSYCSKAYRKMCYSLETSEVCFVSTPMSSAKIRSVIPAARPCFAMMVAAMVTGCLDNRSQVGLPSMCGLLRSD